MTGTAELGEKAPEVPIDCWMNSAPSGGLGGKCIVLEFWGSHCGPCAAAVPHLNALSEQFSVQGIFFIAVTMDERTQAEAFLSRRPMHAYVALDPNGEIFGAFGVRSIPHVFLIDVDRRIRWVGHPASLKPEMLAALLNDEELPSAPQSESPPETRLQERSDDEVMVALTIGKGEGGNSEMSMCVDADTQKLRAGAKGLALGDAIGFLHDMPSTRVRVVGNLPQEFVDLNVVFNGVDLALMHRRAADIFASAFGVRTKVICETTHGWMLSAQSPRLQDVTTPGAGSHANKTQDMLTITGARLCTIIA